MIIGHFRGGVGRVLACLPLLFLALAGSSAQAALTWESIGPPGGDRFVVRVSPVSPGTAFVVGYHAIHRTRDQGETWELTLAEGMAFDNFTDVAFGATDGTELLVSAEASGIWYSPDEGETWEQRSAGLPFLDGQSAPHFSMTSVVVTSVDVAYAIVSADAENDPPAHLVYRSDDMGLTWVSDDPGMSPILPGETVITLLSLDSAGRMWAMVHGRGVYRHDGSLWQLQNGDLPIEALRTTFLAHDASDPDRVLLTTEDAWVFETVDGGLSWNQLPLPAELAALPTLPLAYTAVIDPNNSDLVMVRTNDTNGSLEHPLFRPAPEQDDGAGLYTSVDRGATWFHRVIFAFRLTPDPSTVIEDSVPGVGLLQRTQFWYKTAGGFDAMTTSADGALSFQIKTEGILSTWVNSVWVHPNPPVGSERILLVASEDGLYMGDGTPHQWSYAHSADNPVYTWAFAADPLDPDGVLYATGSPAWNKPENRGVYNLPLSCFGGGCIPAESQSLISAGVWRVVTSPAKPSRIFAATQDGGVLRTDDGGQAWFSMNDGLFLPASVTDIEVNDSGDALFASFRTSDGDVGADPPNQWPPQDQETGGVYLWDPAGLRWEILTGLSFAAFDLEMSSEVTLTLYAATSAGVYRYRPLDGWQIVSPPFLTNDVELDPQRPGYIYAATRSGVFRTTDGGAHWQDISEGLPVRTVYSLDLDPTDGTLYAGTEGASVLRMLADPDPTPVIQPSPASMDFGDVPLGFQGEMDATLTNGGEADLVVQSLISTNPAFTLEGLPAFPVTLTPGSWLEFTVVFEPTVVGPAAAVLTVIGNGENSPVAVPLSGQGYDDLGTFTLTVDPPDATWVVTAPWGGTLARGGGVTEIPLPTGTYSLAWHPIEGLTPPSEEPVDVIIQSGQLTVLDGVYSSSTGEIALGFNDYLVLEDAGNVAVEIIRTGGSKGQVTVTYQTNGSSALPELDYTETAGVLTLEDGATTGFFEVPIAPDTLVENSETFTVTLSNPTGGASLGSPATAIITILDRDLGLTPLTSGMGSLPGIRSDTPAPSQPSRSTERSRYRKP